MAVEEITGMYELLASLEEALKSADPVKRKNARRGGAMSTALATLETTTPHRPLPGPRRHARGASIGS